MRKTRQYNIEGAIINVPQHYDEISSMYLDVLPDFLVTPVYTPTGERVMLTVEDACQYGKKAEKSEGRCIDCGSCKFYRQTEDTLLGVCRHPKMRRLKKGD